MGGKGGGGGELGRLETGWLRFEDIGWMELPIAKLLLFSICACWV